MLVGARKSAVEAFLFALLGTVVMNWPVSSWFESGHKALSIVMIFVGTYLILLLVCMLVISVFLKKDT
ncbi:hypothetical protein V5S96_01195 [Corynebacterium mastitidis]|uniref:Uncharacterized protein n=1 Tax=Corynebacterium mastitidis TaxID=161890 RepID=A0ABU8NVF2_9CORY